MRLMVGMPDYSNYATHMENTHPGQPVMSYEEFSGDGRKHAMEAKVRLVRAADSAVFGRRKPVGSVPTVFFCPKIIRSFFSAVY